MVLGVLCRVVQHKAFAVIPTVAIVPQPVSLMCDAIPILPRRNPYNCRTCLSQSPLPAVQKTPLSLSQHALLIPKTLHSLAQFALPDHAHTLTTLIDHQKPWIELSSIHYYTHYEISVSRVALEENQPPGATDRTTEHEQHIADRLILKNIHPNAARLATADIQPCSFAKLKTHTSRPPQT